GAPVARDPRQRREEVWYLSREYVLTWAAVAPPENPVVAGRWWTPEEAARELLISVEEEIAKNLGVTIGSTLGFDIQGVTVTARVFNLRRGEWGNFNNNLFVIFSHGGARRRPTP